MKEFLKKFFGYYDYDGPHGVLEPYQDHLGSGAFSDWRHFLWIGIVILLSVTFYHLFKRHPKLGKQVSLVLVSYLFLVRLINQIARAMVGAEVPAWRAFPFHLCTILTFLLPFIVIFNLKKLKTPAYTLALMGGTITVLIGDYFDHWFLAFPSIEGMIAHSILILLPIIEIAIGRFRFEFKQSWTVFIGIGLLLIWAWLANDLFFKSYDSNYMYLKENGLPGNLGGDYYFVIYGVLFFLFYLLIFGIPTLYRRFKSDL